MGSLVASTRVAGVHGPNSFFFVLLVLSWWVAIADIGKDMAEFFKMVKNIYLKKPGVTMSEDVGTTEELQDGKDDSAGGVGGKKRAAGLVQSHRSMHDDLHLVSTVVCKGNILKPDPYNNCTGGTAVVSN